jgi:Ca2+-binding RTX toxin-like protein
VVATTDAVALDTITAGTGNDSINIANGTAAWTGEFDFDLISGVTSLATSGASGGINLNVGVTFSAITETTVQTITLTAATITDTDSDLVITNNAASTTTSFDITGSVGADSLNGSSAADTLTGGAGADVLVGGAGADTLTAGAAADNLTGGAGDDSIVLTDVGDTAIDTATFAGGTGIAGSLARVTTLGNDTITGFVTANDLFAFSITDFGAIDEVGAIAQAQVGQLANVSTAINVANGQIDDIGAVDATSGAFVIVGANAGATTDALYFVLAGATDTNTITQALAANEAVQIGTLVNAAAVLADFTAIA